ncbi:hypothetical protein D9611_005114 [Ephemerocybe angulata]|uniref:Copper transporter n=1 Tax=Ephemerocybe angulata TaxID=980116 RepID=A0A8H5BZN8_9AGAR|nr:hypothetical protein D9611_005114 [Tulosesus angulatus]
MGEGQPLVLHWSWNSEHVLFSFIVVRGPLSFGLASLMLIVFCVTERIITSYHESSNAAYPQNSNRWRVALRKSLLYWIAMVFRLFYMLAAMTFNMGLILATSLATTQLFLDLRSKPHLTHHSTHLHDFTEADSSTDAEPLLYQPRSSTGSASRGQGPHPHSSSGSTFVALESMTPTPPTTRPRSKSKPDDIFIHPAESNVARADLLAMQLGLAGDTERVSKLPEYSPVGPEGTSKNWEVGRGRDVARELLLNPGHKQNASVTATPKPQQPRPPNSGHGQLHQRSGSFQIGAHSDSESASEDESEDDGRPNETRNLVR